MREHADVECARCREVFSAGLDGEAGRAELAAAEAHLATCAECRAATERYAAVTRLARLGAAEPGPDLAAAILARHPVGPRVLLPMATPACGCAASCACGCQDGRPCQCGHAAA